MKRVPLSNGGEALVDDADFDLVSRWRWRRGTKGYACRSVGRAGLVLMHRLLSGFPAGQVDHINRDRLDNRRENLRACSHVENCANRAAPRNNTSGFKGVTFDARRGRWRAQIQARGVRRRMGPFDTPEEAAAAYDRASVDLFGAFAFTNFPRPAAAQPAGPA